MDLFVFTFHSHSLTMEGMFPPLASVAHSLLVFLLLLWLLSFLLRPVSSACSSQVFRLLSRLILFLLLSPFSLAHLIPGFLLTFLCICIFTPSISPVYTYTLSSWATIYLLICSCQKSRCHSLFPFLPHLPHPIYDRSYQYHLLNISLRPILPFHPHRPILVTDG